MARNRARSDKLVRSEDGTFGCIWGYNMDVQPIEMCMDPNFFETCRPNLLPGDQIRVTEFKGVGEKKTVTATCTLVVRRKDSKSVFVEFFEGSKIFRYDTPERVEAPVVTAEQDFHNSPKYIKEDGQVEKPAGEDYQIKTSEGIVGSAPTFGQAMEMAKGNIPLNQ